MIESSFASSASLSPTGMQTERIEQPEQRSVVRFGSCAGAGGAKAMVWYASVDESCPVLAQSVSE
jgi:hypothetical protein